MTIISKAPSTAYLRNFLYWYEMVCFFVGFGINYNCNSKQTYLLMIPQKLVNLMVEYKSYYRLLLLYTWFNISLNLSWWLIYLTIWKLANSNFYIIYFQVEHFCRVLIIYRASQKFQVNLIFLERIIF